MKILSLFDGMACGMLAMLGEGIEVEKYDAYEIDKYAIQTSSHNFPIIEHHGDVFKADFTAYRGYDFLVGGSPCTYWSIAQSADKRETTASGLGWELFSQYVRALREAQPNFFIYENNKSMSKDIKASITETFGFDPICINSALVSAQNRQRLYWVGKREGDRYVAVHVDQPEDRGILLKDILESGVVDANKSVVIKQHVGTARDYVLKSQNQVAFEPIKPLSDNEMDYVFREQEFKGRQNFINKPAEEDKSKCVVANFQKGVPYNVCAEPVCVAQRGRNPEGSYEQHFEAQSDGKTNTLTSVQKDNLVAEPLVTTKDGKSFAITANYVHIQNYPNDYAAHTIEKSVKPLVAEPVCMKYERTEEGKALRKDYEAGKIHHGFREYTELHPREDGKSNTLSTVLKDNPICEPICLNSKSGRGGVEGLQPSLQDRIYDTEGKMTAVTTAFNPQICEPIRAMSYPLKDVKESDDGCIAHLDMPRNHDINTRVYGENGKSPTLNTCQGGNREPKVFSEIEPMRVPESTKQGYAEIQVGDCVDLTHVNSKTRRGCEMSDKANCLTTDAQWFQYLGTIDKPVYEVKNGQITIKGKQYPIKLKDGFYIIRKLTVRECMRLQTVPEWYDFPVSSTQAYKMLGNGWTVEVIKHLIHSCLANGTIATAQTGKWEQLSLFDM